MGRGTFASPPSHPTDEQPPGQEKVADTRQGPHGRGAQNSSVLGSDSNALAVITVIFLFLKTLTCVDVKFEGLSLKVSLDIRPV